MAREKITEAMIYDTRPNTPYDFAVCLLPTLDFPGDGRIYKGVHQTAVCCATDSDPDGSDEKVWSWIIIDSDEKQIIGEAMVAHSCELSKWYWCIAGEQEKTERYE